MSNYDVISTDDESCADMGYYKFDNTTISEESNLQK